MPYSYRPGTSNKLITTRAPHNTTIDIFKNNFFFRWVNMFRITIIIIGQPDIRYLGPHSIACERFKSKRLSSDIQPVQNNNIGPKEGTGHYVLYHATMIPTPAKLRLESKTANRLQDLLVAQSNSSIHHDWLTM